MVTEQIRIALRYKYNKPGFLLFEEVKRSTGYTKPERFADAVAISLFPSNGISLIGFEIKTTRQDLLCELRELSKAEAVKQFCDYWILVIPGEEGHKEGLLAGKIQVPDDWGIWRWYKTGGIGSFEVARKPKQLYPKPADRYFLASLLSQGNTAKESKDA